MSCFALETIAGWVLDELPEAEAEQLEMHYFGCAHCFEQAQQMRSLVRQLQTSLPPVLTRARFEALVAQSPQVPIVHVQRGGAGTIQLSARQPVAIWAMDCDLRDVVRVDLRAQGPAGETFFAFSDVPYDSEHGQVLMPCHWHYRAMGVDASFQCRLIDQVGAETRVLGDYILNHEFENV